MQDNPEARNIYRQSAMQSINTIDEINVSLKIIEPKAWLWISVCFCLLVAMIIWSVLGSLTMYVNSAGILLPDNHLKYAEKLMNENMHQREARVNMLEKILNNKRMLYKKHYLNLIDLENAEYEYSTAKYDFLHGSKFINPYVNIGSQAKMTNHKDENHNLINPNENYYALVFVKNSEGKKISTEMDAYILPNNMSEYDYGYIKGKVVNISEYPVTKELAYGYLGNLSLVDEYFMNGSPFLVKIKLLTDRKTHSGFAWTSCKGPPFTIDPGTTVTTKILNKSAPPIIYLIHS